MKSLENKVPNGLVIFRKDTDITTKHRSIFWFVYFLICALAQIWPIYLIANRIKPLILGMPFSMFWVALWICIIFAGALTKFNQEYRR